MDCPVFAPGDTVVCMVPHGYLLTGGKQYTVVEYDPQNRAPLPGYTFPAYVVVENDAGHLVAAHAYRFKKH